MLDVLKELLMTGTAETQDDIILHLKKQGIPINQSKVSRILRKLGAIKSLNDRGHSVYILPRDPLPPSTESSLAKLIIRVVANETLIVIHTNPGSASLIARLLDHQAQELNILGTVAGDDTLFVTPKSIQRIEETLIGIKEMLYGKS